MGTNGPQEHDQDDLRDIKKIFMRSDIPLPAVKSETFWINRRGGILRHERACAVDDASNRQGRVRGRTIGRVKKATGIRVETIRFHECSPRQPNFCPQAAFAPIRERYVTAVSADDCPRRKERDAGVR